MKLKVKKLHEKAKIPRRAHVTDAGLDLTATAYHTETSVESGLLHVYSTGLAFEIPEGHVGLLFPRSSITKTRMSLANSVGVIDSGYRGEVLLKFRDQTSFPAYRVGDRVGQLVVVPCPALEVEEVLDLNTTDRAEKGFGSSGKQ